MATFEDIQKANATIQTTTIERKDRKTGKVTSKEYAEVNQRIKAFRMVYPEGSIITEMLSDKDGVCTFRATVRIPGPYVPDVGQTTTILGVGHAQEKESASYINQTSYIENCETSAVGRALGMAGFGINTSLASAEEMENALNNQNAPTQNPPKKQDRPDALQIAELNTLMESITDAEGRKLDGTLYIRQKFGKDKPEDLTMDEYNKAKDFLTRYKEGK